MTRLERRARSITSFLLLTLLLGCASRSYREIAKSASLRPYVEQLKKTTSSDDLGMIKSMAESELILLHHGYGTGIRNKWLHGERDPQLLRFFRENGVDYPDAMSGIIIYALWDDLNSNLSPAERASIEVKRALVTRRRSNYKKLEAVCEAHLIKSQSEFERCYERYGLPSKNPLNRDPFFHLVIEKTGRVREIMFFEGATLDLKQCLEQTIQQFKFPSFADDESVTLYLLDFPHCRVAERDTLHQR